MSATGPAYAFPSVGTMRIPPITPKSGPIAIDRACRLGHGVTIAVLRSGAVVNLGRTTVYGVHLAYADMLRLARLGVISRQSVLNWRKGAKDRSKRERMDHYARQIEIAAKALGVVLTGRQQATIRGKLK